MEKNDLHKWRNKRDSVNFLI